MEILAAIAAHLDEFLAREKFRVYSKPPPYMGEFQFSIGERDKSRRLNFYLCDDRIYFNESSIYSTSQSSEELTLWLEDLAKPKFFEELEGILFHFREHGSLPRYDDRSYLWEEDTGADPIGFYDPELGDYIPEDERCQTSNGT